MGFSINDYATKIIAAYSQMASKTDLISTLIKDTVRSLEEKMPMDYQLTSVTSSQSGGAILSTYDITGVEIDSIVVSRSSKTYPLLRIDAVEGENFDVDTNSLYYYTRRKDKDTITITFVNGVTDSNSFSVTIKYYNYSTLTDNSTTYDALVLRYPMLLEMVLREVAYIVKDVERMSVGGGKQNEGA